MLKLLQELKNQSYINNWNFYQAKLIADKQKPYQYPLEVENLAILITALISYSIQEGHSCFRLDIENDYFDLKAKNHNNYYYRKINKKINNQPAAKWKNLLTNHIAFMQNTNKANDSATKKPFIFIDNNLLYAYKFYSDENFIANYLIKKSAKNLYSDMNKDHLIKIKQLLNEIFPANNIAKNQINWQQIAVATALTQNFSVISGGPGTGKTTTICKLLVVLQAINAKNLNIVLTAPTGKAATRLTESVYNVIDALNQQQQKILANAQINPAITLHKLLGVNITRTKPKYNENNQLNNIDVMIVDEASMVDLKIMTELCKALPLKTKLILVGDKDQLSAVEGGAILAELTTFAREYYSVKHADYLNELLETNVPKQDQDLTLADNISLLKNSYRFAQNSDLGKLATEINQQNIDAALNLLYKANSDSLVVYNNDNPKELLYEIINLAKNKYQHYLHAIATNAEIKNIFELFNQFRLLAATKNDAFGVNKLNQEIFAFLKHNQLVMAEHADMWYTGKPIIINENDYFNNLVNGDLGITICDKEGSYVYFMQDESKIRKISTNRLFNYDPAYVMTVHKSQGSEFSEIALVLPQTANKILTKELVYTAVTRAKVKVTLFSKQDILIYSLQNSVIRYSGLNQLISSL